MLKTEIGTWAHNNLAQLSNFRLYVLKGKYGHVVIDLHLFSLKRNILNARVSVV